MSNKEHLQERLKELREFVLDLTIREQVYLINMLIGKGNVQVPVGHENHVECQSVVSAELNGLVIEILTEEFIEKLHEKMVDDEEQV